MKKISLLGYQDSGVSLYRVLQPGRVMKREGLVDKAMSFPFSGTGQGNFYEMEDKTYMEVTKDTDVIWCTMPYTEDRIMKLMNLRHHWGCKLIVDIDDNLYAVPHNNVEHVKVEKLMPNIQASLKIADGITVSVPRLQDVYKHLNKEFYVNPNGIDFKLWKRKSKPHEGIRIGWRGASGHKDDFGLVKEVLKEIKKAYPFVTIVTFGNKMGDYEHHEWVGMLDYPKKLASLNLDIAIIPLVDSAYNRSKSNLGYLEFSALKIPTILSPIENHQGMPTLMAKTKHEWFEHLSRLIENSAMRQKLGKENYDFVKENYDVRKQVHPLVEWMEKLPRRTDMEPGTPKK